MILPILIIILVIAFLLLAVVSGGVNSAKSKSKTSRSRGSYSPSVVKSRWTIIQSLLKEGGNGLRQAVIEADKLLDYVLKGQGYHGETMAERMTSAGSKFSRRNNVWAAHKLRNAIAHDVGFDLVASQVRGAINDYERAIKDLGGGL